MIVKQKLSERDQQILRWRKQKKVLLAKAKKEANEERLNNVRAFAKYRALLEESLDD